MFRRNSNKNKRLPPVLRWLAQRVEGRLDRAVGSFNLDRLVNTMCTCPCFPNVAAAATVSCFVLGSNGGEEEEEEEEDTNCADEPMGILSSQSQQAAIFTVAVVTYWSSVIVQRE